MRKREVFYLIMTLLFIGFTTIVFAQEGDNPLDQLEDKYDELYDYERFQAADTNNDGVLDKEELRAEQKDFEYYQDNKRFRHADTNNDGVISLQEAKAERRWEKEHFEELAKNALQDYKRKHPDVDFENTAWLREHPEISKPTKVNQLIAS